MQVALCLAALFIKLSDCQRKHDGSTFRCFVQLCSVVSRPMASILLLFSMLQGSFLATKCDIQNSTNRDSPRLTGHDRWSQIWHNFTSAFGIASSNPTARLSLWFGAQKYPGTLETCSASSWDLQISPWTQFRDFSKLRTSDVLM